MNKAFNILFFTSVLIFFSCIYTFYSSNKNLKDKTFNRNNINQSINEKITNLPLLKDDTYNVIEFNNSITDSIKTDKPRSFWNLLKTK